MTHPAPQGGGPAAEWTAVPRQHDAEWEQAGAHSGLQVGGGGGDAVLWQHMQHSCCT